MTEVYIQAACISLYHEASKDSLHVPEFDLPSPLGRNERASPETSLLPGLRAKLPGLPAG